MPFFLSVRIALVLRVIVTFWPSTTKVFFWRLGLNTRFVRRKEKLTLLPNCFPLPVSSHRATIIYFLLVIWQFLYKRTLGLILPFLPLKVNGLELKWPRRVGIRAHCCAGCTRNGARRALPGIRRVQDSAICSVDVIHCFAHRSGYRPLSILYISSFLRMADKSAWATLMLARAEIPLYATMVMAARIAITTTTIKSSTIVKPDLFQGAWNITFLW